VSYEYAGSHMCGGSIISPYWAVTSAGCTDGWVYVTCTEGFRLRMKYNLSHEMQNNPCTDFDRPWGFQQFEASRFRDKRQIKLVRMSALHTARIHSWYAFLL